MIKYYNLTNFKNLIRFLLYKMFSLAVCVLIILILLVIFITYLFISMIEDEVKIINIDNIDFKKSKNDKMISYYTDELNINFNTVYIINYQLPINSVYWTINFHDKFKCIETINIEKYKTIEKNDILCLLVGNNLKALEEIKKEVIQKHNIKFPYKKLIFHNLKITNNFFIRFESYSNKVNNHDILLTSKKYKLDKIKYEDFNNDIKINSEIRQCENIIYYNKVKSKLINNNYKQVKVNIDTIELYSPIECFTNKSENIYNNKIKIIAVDHFKSRSSLHSHIKFFDIDTDLLLKIEITGELSSIFNKKNEISIRDITFNLPENIRGVYIIEFIYCDIVSHNKVNKETIIPMEVFYENI